MAVEIEAKFWVPDLDDLRRRVLAAGGRPVMPRTLEHNERFDASDGRLRRRGEVLRLRRDRQCTLAYKRALSSAEERSEIEVGIDDLEAARAVLLGLGFVLIFIYDKYRQVLALDDTLIMLDELPFGSFVEIEGPSLQAIGRCAAALGLDWDRRVSRSYLSIYEAMRQRLGLTCEHATFEALPAAPALRPEDLGLPTPSEEDLRP
jgi:adenylate cyclase class 2